MDVVKQWLDPLFGPLVDVAYLAERRDHLIPGPAAPETTSRPPKTAPDPSLPGQVTEIPSQATDRHASSRAATARNNPGKAPSVTSPLRRETDLPNSRRKRRASLRDGGSGDSGKTSS